MRVSVALCTYNGATYLPAQLESLLQQEHQPFELVVCDDQSSDGTLEILEEFAQRAPFQVSLHRNVERLGSTRNFEKAMLLCEGDAIALCDQDDIWYPHKLRVLVAALRDPEVSGVFSDGYLLGSGETPCGTLWHTFGLTGAELASFQQGDAFGVMLRTNRVTGMAFMLRREALRDALPIPANWVHDYWLGFMLVLFGRLVACPEILVGYRIHGAQQLSVPKSFLAEVRRQGLRAVFGELSSKAQHESSRALVQLESLSERLHLDAELQERTTAITQVEEYMSFLRLRSSIQRWSPPRRATAVLTNWRLYQRFAPRAARDRIVDLLSIQLLR